MASLSEKERYQRLFDEYKMCSEQTARLDSNIWQTAGLFSIGSIAGLAALVDRNPIPFGVILAAGVFAVTVSLVWWRFVKRWRSIQDVIIHRTEEIEREINNDVSAFGWNRFVVEYNEYAMGYRLSMRTNACWPKRRWMSLWDDLDDRLKNEETRKHELISRYCNGDEETKHRAVHYEYRGNLPACELLVWTNIITWGGAALYAAYQASGRKDLAVLAVAAVAMILLDRCFLRRS